MSNGALVLCGGGRPYNPQVLDEFWRLAGGRDSTIVVVPTAHREMDAPETIEARLRLVSDPWKERGSRQVIVRHTRDRREADDPAFIAPLREASGIWIGGGEQLRLLEAYRDTAFHRAVVNLYQRGGVVGGSSAGTAVMSEWTIMGEEDTETRLERGWNLLAGTIVDQHFLTRHRAARLHRALDRHPEAIGIGVDEFTAAVIHDQTLHVVGTSSVTVLRYDPSKQDWHERILRDEQTVRWPLQDH